jgi:uncharacterized protein YqgC (DUF456 family)
MTHARGGAACAPASLFGRGLRDPLELETAHAGCRVESRSSLVAAVDDDAYTLDREAGLGEVGREHNPAPSVGLGPKRRVLYRCPELAVQRPDAHRLVLQRSLEQLRRAPDLARARQEGEHVTLVLGQCARDRPGDSWFEAVVRPGRGGARVNSFDGEQPPLGSDERRASKQPRDRLTIECRRHHEDPQRLAQLRLHIERQRKSQVGVQTSLVELIEDHAAHPLERGVPLQPPGEDTFGHDFDTGLLPDARVGARAVANRLADASSSVVAMRVATARAATRRGSSITIRSLPSQAGLEAASGTTVLLPAPGGASSTAEACVASAARRSGSASWIGRSGSVDALTCQSVPARPAADDARAERMQAAGNESESGRMTGDTWIYVLAGLLVLTGLAGAILPALPGVPLVFGGLLLAAWADDFQRVSWIVLVILGLMTLVSFAIDFVATALGAKRVGASKLAIVGAMVGTLGGFFLGLPGLIFGPFVGAVAGEMLTHGEMQKATRAGFATWVGLIFGTLTKLALVFTMLGIFAFAWFV